MARKVKEMVLAKAMETAMGLAREEGLANTTRKTNHRHGGIEFLDRCMAVHHPRPSNNLHKHRPCESHNSLGKKRSCQSNSSYKLPNLSCTHLGLRFGALGSLVSLGSCYEEPG